MTEIIFHVGMGKTGTSSIQASLNASRADLLTHGICYLGMWQELISDEYQGDAVKFRKFLTLPAPEMVLAAEKLSGILKQKAEDEGIRSFLISNEQYFGSLDNVTPFLKQLQKDFQLRILIWARPVDEWLPSACAQWGILHKTNKGPVQKFSDQADRLIREYAPLPRWIENFGDAVTTKLFNRETDPVQDFSSILGVPLSTDEGPRQVRPDAVELLLRAAFNTQHDQPLLPNVYNNNMGKQKRLTEGKGIAAKADLLLGRDDMPSIVARHHDLLEAASRAAGFDLTGSGRTARDLPDRDDLVDEVVGRLLEIVAGQSREMMELRRRIKTLEDRSGQ